MDTHLHAPALAKPRLWGTGMEGLGADLESPGIV